MSKTAEQCLKLAHQHYENFPVARWCLPSTLRLPVSVIYTFARRADDIADEGTKSPQQRLHALDKFKQQLDEIAANQTPEAPLFQTLAKVIDNYQLTLQPFYDLLSAFSQDCQQQRYQNREQLQSYCQRSAAPIGRLCLTLVNKNTQPLVDYSDNICIALQLINFLQDIHSDYYQRDRLYIPLTDLKRYHLKEDDLFNGKSLIAVKQLIDQQIHYCHQLLNQGRPLIKTLSGRFSWQIAATIRCADVILKKLSRRGHHIEHCPRLSRWQLLSNVILGGLSS